MRTIIFFLLLCTQALATPWSELVEKHTYELKQNFQLPQLERSNSLLDFSAGEKFELLETTHLGPLNVAIFTFRYEACPGSQMKTDMEIIPVQGSFPVVEVGAQLETGCKLEIYLESRDIPRTSFFE
jgi:hypothetical protein